jgi:hypothetical protein
MATSPLRRVAKKPAAPVLLKPPPKNPQPVLLPPPPKNLPAPTTGARAVSTAASPTSSPAASLPAPETVAGRNARGSASTAYQAAMRNGRQGIVDAALRLGSPEILAALKADPNFAEYAATLDAGVNDPTSSMAQSRYNEGQGLQQVDESANAGNTYFSGRRLQNRENLSKGYTDARAGYTRDYQSAYNTLMGGMGTARGQYEQDLGGADQMDQDAYLAQQPLPTGPPLTVPISNTPPHKGLYDSPVLLGAKPKAKPKLSKKKK